MYDDAASNGTKDTLPQRIESTLLLEISNGTLEPGARLDEHGLAERFGVSRTPVREALGRLVAINVITHRGKRGFVVTEYTNEELGHIFEMTQEIEVACARIASQRLNLMSRTLIEQAQAKCLEAAQSNDRAGFLLANEAFHAAIYEATKNTFMAELATSLRRKATAARNRKYATHADLIEGAEQHQTLIEAIFSGDVEIATHSMRRHTQDRFMEMLKTT